MRPTFRKMPISCRKMLKMKRRNFSGAASFSAFSEEKLRNDSEMGALELHCSRQHAEHPLALQISGTVPRWLACVACKLVDHGWSRKALWICRFRGAKAAKASQPGDEPAFRDGGDGCCGGCRGSKPGDPGSFRQHRKGASRTLRFYGSGGGGHAQPARGVARERVAAAAVVIINGGSRLLQPMTQPMTTGSTTFACVVVSRGSAMAPRRPAAGRSAVLVALHVCTLALPPA